MNLDDNIFDDELRKALSGLEGDVSSSDWQHIEHMLDSIDASNADFDKKLSETAGGMEGDVSSSDWNPVEQKLDNIDAANNEFDKKLSETVSGMEGAVSEDDWNAINDRLNRKKRRGGFIWWSAAAVALIVIGLLVWDNVQTNKSIDSNEVVGESIADSPAANDLNKDADHLVGRETDKSEISGSDDQKVVDQEPASESPVSKENVAQPESPNRAPIAKGPSVKTPARNDYKEFIFSSLKLITPFVPLDKWPGEFVISGIVKVPNVDPILKKPVTNKGNWEIGIRATPGGLGVLKSTVNPARSGLINHRFFDIAGSSEKATSGYTFGVNVLRYMGDHVYLGSGIYYSQKVERVNYDYVINEHAVIDKSAGAIVGYNPLAPILWTSVQYDGINTFNFAEIPLKFGTLVNVGQSGKWQVRAEAGMSFMTLLSAAGKKPDQTYLTLYNLANYKNLRRIAMGWEVKGGIYYTPGSRFRFGFEPGVGGSVTSLYNNDAPTKLHPYNFGLNLTANYTLFRK